MKIPSKTILFLVGGCALGVSARAATVESHNHPYNNIPATNVFRLKSPPRSELPEPLPTPPPPKLTLQGVTNIPGRPHVLFKMTMPAKPAEPAKEIAYVLSEGERAGEIEVLEINERAGTARFLNHGIEQTLALTK